ncbi:MAG: hypothetical protein Q8941_11580 [Bacteroidota bacterium]|nr:hypothetical protein [Bacteroidota bacterium]
MKKLLLFFFSLYLFNYSIAQVVGPQSAKIFGNAALAGFDQSWVNTENAGASDNKYATFGNLADITGSHTDYLMAQGFGLIIPANAQITGIMAYIESSDMNACTADYNIRIVKKGGIGTSEHSAGDLYFNADSKDNYRTYGNNADLWGESWTPDDIEANDFGIAIAALRAVTGRVTEGRIDNIRIAVYYFLPTTLPLNLISFFATPQKDKVRLEWTTTDESGMDRFEIQRSPEGGDFTSFGTLLCKNQVSTNSYSFTDYSPLPGVSSYRLKILEKSGSVTYSKIIPVHLKADNAATLYPSPWKKGEALFIRNAANEKLLIRFYDDAGEMVAKASTSSGQVTMPPLPNVKGILRYKVFDEINELRGSGALVIY